MQMLSSVWKTYLERVIPIMSIDKLLVYTDADRGWIANPLIDYAMDIGCNVSMAFTDDFEEEDLNDVSISLPSFSSDTLIISIISSSNPNLNTLNAIFPNDGMLLGFAGISIVFSPELPDSFILDFLRFDSYVAVDRLEKILTLAPAGRTMHVLSNWGSNFQYISNGVFEAPNIIYDDKNRSLALPGMEVTIDVVLGSFFGEMVVYGLILPSHDLGNNFIDHYGIVSEDARFKISIQNGVITGVEMLHGCKDEFIFSRFKQLLGEFGEESLNFKVTVGLGHNFHQPPGIAIVDRNMHKSISITMNDQVTIILYDVDLE